MTGRAVRYVGGPLDGNEHDADGWTDEQVRGGSYEIVDGWTDRADYEPDPDGDPYLWNTADPWTRDQTPHRGG